jgi:hypothetical protein
MSESKIKENDKYKSLGFRELRVMYDVSSPTFKKWIEKIPDLGFTPGSRLLTPKQVELIITHLGEP